MLQDNSRIFNLFSSRWIEVKSAANVCFCLGDIPLFPSGTLNSFLLDIVLVN